MADDRGLDQQGLKHLLNLVQDGVVSRRQLRDLGALPQEIRGMLRRGDLVVVHPGVYVNHNGPLSWEQRAWAAVHAYWPAALTRESALPKPPRGAPIHVAIDRKRTVKPVPGVTVHRTPDLDERVQWIKSPPRVSLEHAAIDVAHGKADLFDRFRVFADVVQTRKTTTEQIKATLLSRHGVADRQQLLDLLGDLASGACSVLEREYLLLEQAHGLPASQRQSPAEISGRPAYRDVDYGPIPLIVELNGRVFHDNATAYDADAARDLETLVVDAATTARLSYGQVLRDGCCTIAQIGVLLQRLGWDGTPTSCPRCLPRSGAI